MNLLIDERPLVVSPSLVRALGGSFPKAVVLQQIHWLLQQPGNGIEYGGYKWVWGTYQEWCDLYFTMWEPRTLRKHVQALERDGLLVSAQIKASEWDRTKFYRIDYDALAALAPANDDLRWASNRVTSKRPKRATSKRPERAASYKGTEYTTENSSSSSGGIDTEQAAFKEAKRRVSRLYEENFGLVSSIIVDELTDLLKAYPTEWVEEAIRLAVQHERRNLRYVAGILRKWRRNGKGDRPERGRVETENQQRQEPPPEADLSWLSG